MAGISDIPGWSTSPEAKPMLAEPVREFHIDETLDQTSDDESRSEDVSNRRKTQPEFEMAEDMMFGE